MDRKQKGFTLIEILVVVTIIGVLAGLVVVLIPKGTFEAQKTECQNNVRNIAGLLMQVNPTRFPEYSGANLILYLVKRGDMKGADELKLLFCPGDLEESLKSAEGVEVYKDIDMKKHDFGHLTSYAAADQGDRECKVKKTETKVLLSDDSEDHHDSKGFVVGFTNGAAKFRHKVDDWGLNHDTPVDIGEDSEVEELRCMRAD